MPNAGGSTGIKHCSSLLRALSLEDRQDGSQHAEGVQVQRAVRDVVVLQVQPLVVLDVRAPVAGPPAREAGLHFVVQRAAAVLLQLSRDKGARADDGHVAGHDVEELGQLVERHLAQDAVQQFVFEINRVDDFAIVSATPFIVPILPLLC